MSTDQTRRPGRKTESLDLASYNLTLERETADWGKEQPGGLSETVRRLLRREYNVGNRVTPETVGDLFANGELARLARAYALVMPNERDAILGMVETFGETNREAQAMVEEIRRDREELRSQLLQRDELDMRSIEREKAVRVERNRLDMEVVQLKREIKRLQPKPGLKPTSDSAQGEMAEEPAK